MIEVPLRGPRGRGLSALIDDDDLPLVADRYWHLTSNGYAACGQRGRWALMHRVIAGLSRGDGFQCDHIDLDHLNNQRTNLRVCTHALNQQNKPLFGNGSSRYRGVYWSKECRKWVAQATWGGKARSLGLFTDELEAARAAQRARLEHMPFAVEPVLL